MNGTNVTVTNPLWANMVAAGSMVLLGLPGLVLYSMIVIVILRNPQTFGNASFYTLVLSLAICEIIELGPYALFYWMPCVLLQQRIYGDTMDNLYGAVFCIVFYFISLFTSGLIALNRYFAVCHFSIYQDVFSKNRTRLYLAIIYILGIIYGVFIALPGFGYLTYPLIYTAAFDPNGWGIPYYNYFDRGADILVFLTFVFCYVSILLKRPTKAAGRVNLNQIEKMKREKAERKLALQFGVIVIVFIIYQMGFNVLLNLSVDNPFYYLTFTLLYIIFSSCNPYVYLTFNSDIRSHFLRMFCKCHSSNSVVSVTITGQTK